MKSYINSCWSAGWCLLALFAGLSRAASDPDPVVVTVNGSPIVESEVIAEADQRINIYAAKTAAKGLIYEESSRDQTRDFMREEVLQVLIDRRLTAGQLRSDGIEITDADIDSYFINKTRERGQTLADAEREIAEQGKTMQGVRERIRWNILGVKKLFELHSPDKKLMTEDEARQVYLGAMASFKQEHERRVSHILILATPDHDEAFKKAARIRAEELLARARAGEDFAELARVYSEDRHTRARGGDLGWSPRGFVSAPGNDPFGDAAFAIKSVGDIGDLTLTLDGYEIIKLTGLKEARQKRFDEVKNEIIERTNYLYIEKFWNAYAAEMFKRADIVWSPEELARKAERETKEREALAQMNAAPAPGSPGPLKPGAGPLIPKL